LTTTTTILLPHHACPPLTNHPAVLPTSLACHPPLYAPIWHTVHLRPQWRIHWQVFFPNLVSGLTPWNVILYYIIFISYFSFDSEYWLQNLCVIPWILLLYYIIYYVLVIIYCVLFWFVYTL
jgi:hypothetical protein